MAANDDSRKCALLRAAVFNDTLASGDSIRRPKIRSEIRPLPAGFAGQWTSGLAPLVSVGGNTLQAQLSDLAERVVIFEVLINEWYPEAKLYALARFARSLNTAVVSNHDGTRNC